MTNSLPALEKQLKEEIDMCEWYHKQFKEHEVKVIALKEVITFLKETKE